VGAGPATSAPLQQVGRALDRGSLRDALAVAARSGLARGLGCERRQTLSGSLLDPDGSLTGRAAAGAAARPAAGRADRSGFTVLQNAALCPIVFSVLERLKAELLERGYDWRSA
jgi:hypothetical protein